MKPASIFLSLLLLGAAFGPVAASISPPVLVGQWGSAGSAQGQLMSPLQIAFSGRGTLYIGEDNGRIQEFTTDGQFLQAIAPARGNSDFGGFAVAGDGSLYISSHSVNRILHVDADGNGIGQWGSPGSGNGQFSYPQGLAVASDGTVYVDDYSNGRVQAFTHDGQFLRQWSSQLPYRIAVNQTGDVLVVDAKPHGDCCPVIRKYDSAGQFLQYWDLFISPWGVTPIASGDVYVADAHGEVRRLTDMGTIVCSWTIAGNLYPIDVAVGPSGAVYVLNYAGSVMKFEYQGSVPTRPMTWGGLKATYR